MMYSWTVVGGVVFDVLLFCCWFIVVYLQLLCLVGEAFDDHSEDICGAVVNIRTKGDKIAVWTTSYENRDAVTHIG